MYIPPSLRFPFLCSFTAHSRISLYFVRGHCGRTGRGGSAMGGGDRVSGDGRELRERGAAEPCFIESSGSGGGVVRG